MIRGIYASAAALVSEAARQDLLAGNLANVTTLGYRRRRATAQGFPDLLEAAAGAQGSLCLGRTQQPATLDLSQGPLQTTDNPLDLALVGDGFFVVKTPRGLRYTRAGRFTLDAAGRLVTPDGYAVLGQKGEIKLPPGRVEVTQEGLVSVEGKPVDRLRLVAFPPDASLISEGHALIACTDPEQKPSGLRVVQGAVEGSNVAAASELARMIRNLRVYEANITALRTQDETLGRLLGAVQK